MRKSWIIILFFICPTWIIANDIIPISGNVYELNSLNPVPYHPVEVYADSGINLGLMLTDEYGFFADTILTSGAQFQTLTLITLDCNFEPHILTFPLPAPVGLYAEFNICVDSIPMDCIASFIPYPEDSIPLTYAFINTSIGNYDNAYWEFGDGTTSTFLDPLHTYESPGEYLVCLTISSSDSIYPCYDNYCEYILIGDTLDCKASFQYIADSLNNVPNQFIFFDQSTGNIDSWFWDFGDGTFSQESNPIHIYANEGNYEVCLTVSSSNNPTGCFDTYCESIVTPEYIFFGGQLFAGDYPINNPTNTGDTGVVYLYRVYESSPVAIDTQIIYNDYGLYAFNNLLEGKYLVKAGLSKNSQRYEQFFPAYYPNKLVWQQSEIITLSEPVYDANIHMAQVPVMSSGPGIIAGEVIVMNESYKVVPPSISNIDVMLFGSAQQPLRRTKTNSEGHFEFSNLPFNSYYITADLTGWDAQTQQFGLNENNTSALGVTIGLFESGTLDIFETEISEQIKINLFPNPATDFLNLSFEADKNERIHVAVSDITGRIILQEDYSINRGNELINIDIKSFQKGIYLISVHSSDKAATTTKKFIK